MACIDSKGELTASALAILKALSGPRTPEAVRDLTGQRLFRVRYTLREMYRLGLVTPRDGSYALTDLGRAKLAEQSG